MSQTKKPIEWRSVLFIIFCVIVLGIASYFTVKSFGESRSTAIIHIENVFTDINGDGTIDYVKAADVIFNYGDGYGFNDIGTPTPLPANP